MMLTRQEAAAEAAAAAAAESWGHWLWTIVRAPLLLGLVLSVSLLMVWSGIWLLLG